MVTFEQDNENIIAAIYGEIDHHTARCIREEVDTRISRAQPKRCTLDFGHVTFMDSSGIGLIMGRYKLLSSLGGELFIKNTPDPIKRVMRLSGIEKLATLE